MAFSDSAGELKYLQRCMSDLVSVLALPAVWSGQDPRQIVTTLHDALMAILNLGFLYTRVRVETDGEPLEELRTAPPYATTQNAVTIRNALHERFGDNPWKWPAVVRSHLGGQETSLVSMQLGIEGELGVVLAGSERADFPTQSERLLLGVVANQITVGLQQARLLSEQKQIADELEQRVAERTASLAAANEKLRKEIEDRKQSEEALRESEQRFRLIVDGIAGLVAIMSPAGELEVVNRQVLAYFGKTVEQLKGWSTSGAVHPDDMPAVRSAWTRSLETAAAYDIDHRLLRADGEYRWFHARGPPLCDAELRVLRWYVLLTDINDRRQAEEALTKARAELAHVARVISLGVLTASIAHEVNQPLAGIVMNASTCMRMLDSNPPNVDGARETARRTIRDGNRASDVVTRLRALFRNKDAAVESVDLNDAAREVIAVSLSELQSNRILVQNEFAENLPVVQGDRVQLQQVILNLLRNASDAMRDVEDRPRRLLIKTECDGCKNVQLTVQDTGIGFAPHAANRLFESFYTTKDDGMGIGLSISRSIIEAHRGRHWASANDGPGSSFAFSIPQDGSIEPA
jgi:PAS domain S-box-containing protein